MRRIILAIDNYNQLTYLHVRLKKIGFDVEGVQTERSFEESLITFNPQLILASTRDSKINGLTIVSKIKKNMGIPKIVLLKSSSKSYPANAFDAPEIDRVLTSPYSIKDLIRCFAELLNLKTEKLLDKYEKVFTKIDEKEAAPTDWLAYNEKKEVTEEKKEKTTYRKTIQKSLDLKKNLNPEKRKERFEKFIKTVEPYKKSQLSGQDVEKAVQQIRSEKRTKEIEHLDQERMAFVKALFSHVK